MKRFVAITLIVAAAIGFATHASAADYTFTTEDTTSYYKSTDYTDIFAVEYNYGGTNVIDYEPLPVLPGLFTEELGAIPQDGVEYGLIDAETIYAPAASTDNFIVNTTAFTDASTLKRSDGSIGTLAIPSLGISVKAYEGTSSDSMAKGVGHFTGTSGWDGNICVAGHNRGAAYTIGGVKDLKLGDTIKYTTTLGTRTYSVTIVGTISSTDWSYITDTSDNRITIITCLANQPNQRVVVQATEVK